MQMLKLGPNGALVYCMEFLETNFDWLKSAIKKFPKETYFLFDFPGQVSNLFLLLGITQCRLTIDTKYQIINLNRHYYKSFLNFLNKVSGDKFLKRKFVKNLNIPLLVLVAKVKKN
jgi:hypothetical protein